MCTAPNLTKKISQANIKVTNFPEPIKVLWATNWPEIYREVKHNPFLKLLTNHRSKKLWTTSRINTKNTLSRHIVFNLLRTKDKDNFFKIAKEQSQIMYSEIRIRMIEDFSLGIMQARRQCSDIFKVLKEKNNENSFKNV